MKIRMVGYAPGKDRLIDENGVQWDQLAVRQWHKGDWGIPFEIEIDDEEWKEVEGEYAKQIKLIEKGVKGEGKRNSK